MLVPKLTTCDVCFSGEKATYFCIDCNQELCTTCKICHTRIKKLKEDKIVPIVYLQHKTKCHYCSEEEAVFCCERCHQEMGHNKIRKLKEKESNKNELGSLNTTNSYTTIPFKTSITTAKIISTISVKGEFYSSLVLIPLKDDTIWISRKAKQCLTLIDRSGNIIKQSVKLCDSFVMDAKSFGDDILITCYHVPQILKLSENGNAVSPFYILPDDNHLTL